MKYNETLWWSTSKYYDEVQGDTMMKYMEMFYGHHIALKTNCSELYISATAYELIIFEF